MPFVHSLNFANSCEDEDTHTVIFVDVDGVLNLGIRDDLGGAPLLFSDANLEHARRLVQTGRANAENECVQKLVAVDGYHLGPEEEGTLGTLAACAPANVSPILAERLAQIIRAAGPNRTVVLSSSWRKPQHRQRAARLEQEISRHLGETFAFNERTPLRDDSSAQGRLECIGDFLGNLRELPKGKLRLLVLEDFFITPLKGWACDGVTMDSPEKVEQYLLRRLPASVTATVRLVHTYHEWRTPTGLLVQVGVGLTKESFARAMDFLNDDACGCNTNPMPDSFEPEDKSANEGIVSDEIVATKPAKDFILPAAQDQKILLESLATPLPWLSITSLWNF